MQGDSSYYALHLTLLWTDEGWMYLAVVIDLYSRAVIGWSIQPTMSRQLVCDALMMALWRRGFPRGVLFHSDRGSQYCSNDYQKLLKSSGFICSMSRKGNCWDNAVAESFFHSIKTELIYTERYASHLSPLTPSLLFNLTHYAEKVSYANIAQIIIMNINSSLIKTRLISNLLLLRMAKPILSMMLKLPLVL